jgi:hypothetical protein
MGISIWQYGAAVIQTKGPGKLWIPEEIGRRRQKDDPPFLSGTAQGTQ